MTTGFGRKILISDVVNPGCDDIVDKSIIGQEIYLSPSDPVIIVSREARNEKIKGTKRLREILVVCVSVLRCALGVCPRFLISLSCELT